MPNTIFVLVVGTIWAVIYVRGVCLARREGFCKGVLHGWMLGRFPEHGYVDKRFAQAAEITDKLEADVAWDQAMKE